jgi:hypothetical protein
MNRSGHVVYLLGQGIGSSQGLYLHEQHNTYIRASRGIRTRDLSVEQSKIGHAKDATSSKPTNGPDKN